MSQRLKSGKRLCSLFLSLCLLCSLFVSVPVEAAETPTSGDWKYVILEDGNVEITGYNGEETEVVIPGTIEGKSVTGIGDWTFRACSSLTSVEIPSSVTSIGNFTFYDCSSLTSIDAAENSQSYASKDGILYNKSCETLIRCPEGKQGIITIPSSVASIGEYAFYGCSSLTNIEIPSSVTSIGAIAFGYCSSVTSIEIPKSVTSIGYYAFGHCSNLRSITIPSSVIWIGVYMDDLGEHHSAFSGCSSELIIYGKASSYAETYAESYKIKFKTCDTYPPVTDPAIPHTCTETGKTEGSHCGVCGEIIQEQKIVPATGHTYQPTTQKATTKKNGTIKEKCSACGYIEKTKTTTIYAASKIKLLKTSFTYNGKNKKPTVILKDSKGKPLSKDSYKITYPKTSKNVGKYTVIVTLQGNYSGTVKLTYQIIPKSTSITELDARKKGFIIEWKKQTGQTTGYQIQYSTSKKFKGAKTVTIKKNKTVSKSIGKLKADEKYYVRVRTYKTVKVNGKSVKLYSEWSKTRTTIPTVGKVYRASVRSLYQTDNRSKIRYGGDKITTVASSGCGGVSIAMALNALKNQKTYTGKNVMQWMADHGYYYGYGTMQSGLYAYAANQGLKVKYADTSDTLISELKKGAVAIAIVKDKTGHEYFANATSSGHYILISGFKVQRGVEQVYVNNPMKTKTSGWFDLQKLEKNVKTEREGYANSYVIISQ